MTKLTLVLFIVFISSITALRIHVATTPTTTGKSGDSKPSENTPKN